MRRLIGILSAFFLVMFLFAAPVAASPFAEPINTIGSSVDCYQTDGGATECALHGGFSGYAGVDIQGFSGATFATLSVDVRGSCDNGTAVVVDSHYFTNGVDGDGNPITIRHDVTHREPCNQATKAGKTYTFNVANFNPAFVAGETVDAIRVQRDKYGTAYVSNIHVNGQFVPILA